MRWIPDNSLDMGLYNRLVALSEQMMVDGDWFRDEDEFPLPDILAHFVERLQEVCPELTDEHVKEAIHRYLYRPNPAHLLAALGVKITGKACWTGD